MLRASDSAGAGGRGQESVVLISPGGSEARGAQFILRVTVQDDRVAPLSPAPPPFPRACSAGIGVPSRGRPPLLFRIPGPPRTHSASCPRVPLPTVLGMRTEGPGAPEPAVPTTYRVPR